MATAKIGDLLDKIKAYNPEADLETVERAYEFSARVHRGQKRISGEPYLVHPLAVAHILADLRLDVPAVATGLLHDTVEDTLTTIDEIQAAFGDEIAALVDGVTKIGLIEASSREEAEARSMGKMLLASAQDIRVLLIKLADRAHNMRTIEHLPEERARRVAQETLDIYAPLAHRLGINWLKKEFEDTAFRVLWPADYAELRRHLARQRVEREGYIREVAGLIRKRLLDAGIDAEVTGRTKSAYSIFRKMREQGLAYEDIADVVGFRVIVDADRDCYDALGIIHRNWPPVPGRFRDYIALPKANRYQSLHTTVVGPYGERMEVQIRTREMHLVAEYGIAAHWRYKTAVNGSGADRDRFEWLHQLLELQKQLDDPRRYLKTVKEDLFSEDVLVFTPKGDVVRLPQGSTVIDFAYRIHSEIGDHCTAARIDGQLAPLRTVLRSGQQVEVITTEDQRPSREWLKIVRTQRARERILAAIKADERAKALKLGRILLERDLARHHLDLSRLRREGRMAEILKKFRRSSEEDLLEAIGRGTVRSHQVIEYLLPGGEAEKARTRRGLRRWLSLPSRSKPSEPEVRVYGTEETMVRFAKCCQPLPGEPIAGFMTRGRGVTVHAAGCERLQGADPSRRLEVEWEPQARAPRTVRLEVTSVDRPGLLAALSQAISTAGINIDRAFVRTSGDGKALNVFEMRLTRADELETLIRRIQRIPGVESVRRRRF
ncbi:MAG: bifunctional (p)ppGpp synthetase/guanosine-3',5'-bis(diphosphate) 3'-pyrophosphohydrolase [Candidatus Dadabacteria bacterium]|nr:MAG: bifunctional (p)ppGpp synthetase/guanosine-3',5'-bis(diphosphate) 3'-pyrophosphohydrolase [Candidatus Dadabacteria bacterium]